ncbi:dnaJ homolog subfamily C member 30-like [Lingula anatina]|uniref:DnaJ homolog subfamily C member 30-like n=1 Tax=Lingula anatina TaxID=7574 RepID=A0A1S3JZV5_LINAN|nr:dnaJ homolog subfamily C member 30-like [Lingula anatina]|eukprot:XP_013415827.1 dnaJ homolog subfamily C member 30-like [Lingula anatina]
MAFQRIQSDSVKVAHFVCNLQSQHVRQPLRCFRTSQQKHQFQNHYATLGISHTASAKQIKAAYIELSKKFHPDRSSASNAHEKFTEINKAYEVIGNDSMRRKYDNEFFLHFPSKFKESSTMSYKYPQSRQGPGVGQHWKTPEDFDRWYAENYKRILEHRRQMERDAEKRRRAFIKENQRIMRELFNQIHDTIVDGGRVFAVFITIFIPCLLTYMLCEAPQSKKKV